MDWLERRYISDLDARAEKALREAGLHFQNDAVAEKFLSEAAGWAPDHPAVHLAYYRYHLYKHQYPQAEAYARRCLAQVAAELSLPSVLLDTLPTHADFTAHEPRIRFWLYGMQALAYVVIRDGREDEGKVLLRKVIEVDPTDQTKSRVLLETIERAQQEEPCD